MKKNIDNDSDHGAICLIDFGDEIPATSTYNPSPQKQASSSAKLDSGIQDLLGDLDFTTSSTTSTIQPTPQNNFSQGLFDFSMQASQHQKPSLPSFTDNTMNFNSSSPSSVVSRSANSSPTNYNFDLDLLGEGIGGMAFSDKKGKLYIYFLLPTYNYT